MKSRHAPAPRGGGTRGVRLEILVSSLPAALQLKYEAENPSPPLLPIPAPRTVAITDKRLRDAYERERLIAPAYEALQRGETTEAIIQTIAAQPGMPCVKTLQTALRRYTAGGVFALLRKARGDSRRSRIVISKKWDAAADAAGVSAEKKQQIADAIRHRVKELWESGANGRNQIADFAIAPLLKLSRDAGLDLTEKAALEICRLPPHFVRAHRRHQKVHVVRTNAKETYNNLLPVIHRDKSNLLPGDIVESDGTPPDIYYRRGDGSLATPKAIVWVDLATSLMCATFNFHDKGRGTTQLHCARSYIEIVTGDRFLRSVPRQLRLDNGPEYGDAWVDFAATIQRIAHVQAEAWNPISRCEIYNSRGKGTAEAIQGILNRNFFSAIAGHVGSDRTKKKSANLGREPEPFPGTPEELEAELQVQVQRYNNTRQGRNSHLHGKSPREALEGFIARGWRPVSIARHHLEACFSRPRHATVRNGQFKIGGLWYAAPELLLLSGETIEIWEPLLGDGTLIPFFAERGGPLSWATLAPVFLEGDIAGAKQRASDRRAFRSAVTDSAVTERPARLLDASKDFNALHAQQTLPASGATVIVPREQRLIATGRRALPAPGTSVDRKNDAASRQLIAARRFLASEK